MEMMFRNSGIRGCEKGRGMAMREYIEEFRSEMRVTDEDNGSEGDGDHFQESLAEE